MTKIATEAVGKLPEFRSHKIVRAGLVLAINNLGDGNVELELQVNAWNPESGVLGEPDTATVLMPVDEKWMERWGTSCVGGYYVAYDDGYASWSPRAAFESGYKHRKHADAQEAQTHGLVGALGMLVSGLKPDEDLNPKEPVKMVESVLAHVREGADAVEVMKASLHEIAEAVDAPEASLYVDIVKLVRAKVAEAPSDGGPVDESSPKEAIEALLRQPLSDAVKSGLAKARAALEEGR